MKIFLAGGANDVSRCLQYGAPYILCSYYVTRRWRPQAIQDVLQNAEMFLLDSGAFTFMHTGETVDWDSYLSEYISFINKWHIQYFFELDLDDVIGESRTAALTRRLEQETGRKSIPVFHACRGIKRWREMCQEYNLVAISAARKTKECRWANNKAALCRMVQIAHEYGAKVHGLGYTRLDNINDTVIPFDSVDSTTYLTGSRYAVAYKFTGSRLSRVQKIGCVKDGKNLDDWNIQEWIKMCRYKAKDDKW